MSLPWHSFQHPSALVVIGTYDNFTTMLWIMALISTILYRARLRPRPCSDTTYLEYIACIFISLTQALVNFFKTDIALAVHVSDLLSKSGILDEFDDG